MPVYKFAPSANISKGPHALESTIIIQSKSVAFSDEIPKQFVNLGNKDFVDYVKIDPLRYAFCNFPDPFYPKEVCEFYYTCSIDTFSGTITGTIGDGRYRGTIDALTPPTTETTNPLIQDVNSPKPTSPPPQAESVPIMTAPLHQDNQGESNSNFETVVLSQLSLIVPLTYE
ncbi:unnamed protein product [Lactuca saligna]|uniref:Uncharacterized protein n=1 Tax=Lactuca saligna TaxID=75948 RepID=A0AA36A0V8_LACSI|nr:unnamed protein product [Lactuca saligna]